MVDGRATSRPRLCLSCATCRRRKVRCTKEQPACNSCVRTNEECRYDKHAWKKANAQAKQNKATNNHQNKDRVSKRPEISTQQEHWDDWIGQPFEPMQVQSNLNEDFITQPNLLEQRSHNPIPPSTPNSNQGDTINDNSNSVDITAPSVGDCCYSNGSQSGIFDDFSNISSWSSTNQDSLPASSTPLRRTISAPRPSSTVSNHQYNAFLPRAETPTDELPRACSLKNTLTQETHSSQNVLESSVGSAERQTSEGTTRNNQQPPGHFSVRSEAQVRYVSAAFWGYVKNCVSSAAPALLTTPLTIARAIGTLV